MRDFAPAQRRAVFRQDGPDGGKYIFFSKLLAARRREGKGTHVARAVLSFPGAAMDSTAVKRSLHVPAAVLLAGAVFPALDVWLVILAVRSPL
jgi:hypothetical protein